MANGAINLVNLDFSSFKESLKTYLSSQSQFSDYDFDGSNMSVLLDVLAYNTYLNSFYLNMVASEMFLDSAQLRDSIVSHAKELNYLPRSFRSAKASIRLTITPSNNSISSVTIPRGTTLTSKVGSNTFLFSVPDNVVLTSSTGVFVANTLDIFEGTYITDSFVFDASSETQRFVLTDPTVDTTSIKVYVTEDNGGTVSIYEGRTSYLNTTPTSKIFFIQPAEKDQYEILFGNGTFGLRPKDGAVISVVYRVCSGELPNGCSLFSVDNSIDGHSNVVATTLQSASGGSVHETNQSIKNNATRFFQTQERAVTANDYKNLLRLTFPEINSVNVYGGEEADPPRFGKVVICFNVSGQDRVSENQKEIYASFIRSVSPLSIDPVFTEPEFLNAEITTSVKFNINTARNSQEDIQSLVNTKIRLYNESNLNRFDVKLRSSVLSSEIDDADNSILSNETSYRIYKEFIPNTDPTVTNTYRIKFNNPILESVHGSTIHAVQSSPFITVSDKGELVKCILEDDGKGIVNIVSFADQTHPIVRSNVGSVNYTDGTVSVTNITIREYDGGSLKVFVIPKSTDISGKFDDVLRIKDSDVFVTVSGERE